MYKLRKNSISIDMYYYHSNNRFYVELEIVNYIVHTYETNIIMNQHGSNLISHYE